MLLQELLPTAPTTTIEALNIFDAAEAVDPDFMIGTWHGAEVPTGHPMDGLLEASGWWGKQFIDAETVHPLLFPDTSGRHLWPLNPALQSALKVVFGTGHLIQGLELITKHMEREAKGLKAVQEKSGQAPAQRLSRLLLLASDGSDRFYRDAASLLHKHEIGRAHV